MTMRALEGNKKLFGPYAENDGKDNKLINRDRIPVASLSLGDLRSVKAGHSRHSASFSQHTLRPPARLAQLLDVEGYGVAYVAHSTLHAGL